MMLPLSTPSPREHIAPVAGTHAVVHPFKVSDRAVSREYIAPPALQKGMRRGDRFFAENTNGRLGWFEVTARFDESYSALQIDAEDPCEAEFNLRCSNDDWGVVGVDMGPRFARKQSDEAKAFFTSLRHAGDVCTLDSFLASHAQFTNQVHFNPHAQAVACLALGQYFVCGKDIWVVVQSELRSFLGRRLRDEALSHFARDGQSTNLKGVKVGAAIMAEAPYKACGWEEEYERANVSGLYPSRLFCLSPGSLNSAVIGTSLVLNAGLGLSAEKWEVTDRYGDELQIAREGKCGVINVRTGEGAAGAKRRHFLAVIVTAEWVPNDLTTAFDQVLRYS